MNCLPNAEFSTIFEDFVVQGQGLVVRGQRQGQIEYLVNWSSSLVKDKKKVKGKTVVVFYSSSS